MDSLELDENPVVVVGLPTSVGGGMAAVGKPKDSKEPMSPGGASVTKGSCLV